MMIEDNFKTYNNGDKIQIRSEPRGASIKRVYFQSVYTGFLNYQNINFQRYSIELSALTRIEAQ